MLKSSTNLPQMSFHMEGASVFLVHLQSSSLFFFEQRILLFSVIPLSVAPIYFVLPILKKPSEIQNRLMISSTTTTPWTMRLLGGCRQLETGLWKEKWDTDWFQLRWELRANFHLPKKKKSLIFSLSWRRINEKNAEDILSIALDEHRSTLK